MILPDQIVELVQAEEILERNLMFSIGSILGGKSVNALKSASYPSNSFPVSLFIVRDTRSLR